MVIQYESFIGAGEIYIKGSAWNPPSTHLWGVCKVYEDYRRCTRSCTGSWSENGDGVCAKICVTLIDEVIMCLSWVGIFMVEISPCGYGSTNVVTPPLSGDLQVEILIQILAYLLHFWPTEIQSNCYILLVKNSDYKEYPTNYEDFLFESQRTLTNHGFSF